MTMYGLCIRDLDADDLVWFTTERSLEPGAYMLDRRQAPSSDVYIAESIPALVLQVCSLLEQVENQAQGALGTPDIPRTTEGRIESRMTEGLLQRLTETSAIWMSSPAWEGELRPAPDRSG